VKWKLGSTEISAGTTLSASQNNEAIGSSSSFNKITAFSVVITDAYGSTSTVSKPPSGWTSPFAGDSDKHKIMETNFGVSYNSEGAREARANNLVYNVTTGRWEAWKVATPYDESDGEITYGTPAYSAGYYVHSTRGMAPPPQTITLNINVEQSGRTFTFTNNLAISCVLEGDDPYDDVTVGAGATAVATRNSTDGSFSITGRVSGSSGDNPYSTVEINDGTGSVNEDAYTGVKSVSAF